MSQLLPLLRLMVTMAHGTDTITFEEVAQRLWGWVRSPKPASPSTSPEYFDTSMVINGDTDNKNVTEESSGRHRYRSWNTSGS